MLTEGTRVCSSCKVSKPFSAFHNGKRIYWCKACHSEYAKTNRAKRTEQSNAWAKAHPENSAYQAMRYRNQKTQAMPFWADESVIKGFYIEAKRRTEETGIPHEVDHIVPLKSPVVCGLHVPANLQVTTKAYNRDKSNSLI